MSGFDAPTNLDNLAVVSRGGLRTIKLLIERSFFRAELSLKGLTASQELLLAEEHAHLIGPMELIEEVCTDLQTAIELFWGVYHDDKFQAVAKEGEE